MRNKYLYGAYKLNKSYKSKSVKKEFEYKCINCGAIIELNKMKKQIVCDQCFEEMTRIYSAPNIPYFDEEKNEIEVGINASGFYSFCVWGKKFEGNLNIMDKVIYNVEHDKFRVEKREKGISNNG